MTVIGDQESDVYSPMPDSEAELTLGFVHGVLGIGSQPMSGQAERMWRTR